MADSTSNIVNLGSNRLNINTTTAKGLEKAIAVIAQFIIKSQQGLNKIVYGDPKKRYARQSNNKGDVNTALNNGLLNVVDTIASVDVCNILNYIANQVPGGGGFNPNKPPDSQDPIARAKYALQKSAYDIQVKIDQYSNVYLNPNNAQSRAELSALLNELIVSLNAISDPQTQIGLTNPALQKNFPNLSVINNFINNALGKFNQYTDASQLPVEEIQRALKLIQEVRTVCVAIQALNSPASAINFLDSTFDTGIQEQFQRIQRLVNPARLIPLIKAMLRTANNLNSIGRKVIGFVRTGQGIIQLILLIRATLKVVVSFLKKLPIPNIFTAVGITSTFSDIIAKIEKFLDKLTERLGQINAVLSLIIAFIENFLAIIDQIIAKLRIILANLEACSNVDPELVQDIKNTVDDLQSTRDSLQSFLDTYNSNKKLIDTRFGDYNIEIVTEQVVDEGINLKRRFGIAIGRDGVAVVQSTPTFASLDQIIINEVKVLLVSRGFVRSSLQGASLEEISGVLDAAQFLEEGSIDPETLSLGPIESIDAFEDDSDELGLQSFVNNLPGGKKLRKQMRRQMAKANGALTTDLRRTDPNSRFTSNIIKQREQETIRNKIKDLQEERKELTKALLIPNPISRLVIVKKISDIDKEIEKLKNSLK